jgi:RNA polymerase sigma-70 factor (ECF subfamily)
VANVHGPDAGIAAVEAIRKSAELQSYYLLYAVLGDFEARRGNFRAAAEHFRRSLELTDLASEKAFLAKRILVCQKDGSVVASSC